MRDIPIGLCIWMFGSKLVELFGEVVAYLLTLKEVASGEMDFKVKSLMPLPVHALCFVLVAEEGSSWHPGPAMPATCCHASLT